MQTHHDYFFFENRTNKNSSEQSEKIGTFPLREKENNSFLSEIMELRMKREDILVKEENQIYSFIPR